MNDNKRLKLAIALEQERDRLPRYNAFGRENDLSEYADTLMYLKTGFLSEDYEHNDMLMCCVEDIETMYKDYEIK